MKRGYRISFLLISCCFMCAVSFSCLDKKTKSSEKNSVYSWMVDEKMCALKNSDQIVWQLNFDKTKDKPYFHPLRSPKGHDLTLERPKDHPWHRGLWFSWKYINHINYWEEDPEIGLSDGRSIITAVDVKTHDDFSAKITLNITYQKDEEVMLKEIRVLDISKPTNDEYTIHWHQSFSVETSLELDLEKPAVHGGLSWGGYAGLSYRVSESMTNHQFLSSEGWESNKSITGYGKNGTWMDITAQVKGFQKEYVGLTIFDSPENPRYPSPWYVWFEEGEHAFFTPSLLFNGSMNFTKGDEFVLQYGILVHDGKRSLEQLNQWTNLMD